METNQKDINLCDDCINCFSRIVNKDIKDKGTIQFMEFTCKRIPNLQPLMQTEGMISTVTQCSDYKQIIKDKKK